MDAQPVADEGDMPADSTLAAYCNNRDSARPAGSYRKKLHRFSALVEGGLWLQLADAVVEDLLHLLAAGYGPACLKSRIGRKSVESFSLLSSRDGSCLHCSFSNRRNRDGSSKCELNFRLFAQPGPCMDGARGVRGI